MGSILVLMERAVGGIEVGMEEVQVGEARKGRLKHKVRLIKCLEGRGSGDNFPKSSVVICESHLGQVIIQVHPHRYKYFISLV